MYANDVAEGFHPVRTDHRTMSKTVKDMTLKLAGFDKQKLAEDLINQGLSSHKISDILKKKERDLVAEHVSVYAAGYDYIKDRLKVRLLDAVDDVIISNILKNNDEPDEEGVRLQGLYDDIYYQNWERII